MNRLYNLANSLYYTYVNPSFNQLIQPFKSNLMKLTGGSIGLVGAFTIYHTHDNESSNKQCTCPEHTSTHTNELLYSHTLYNQSIVSHCPSMQQFCPPRYITNPHVQTIIASLYRLSPSNESAPFNLLQSITQYIPFTSYIQQYIQKHSIATDNNNVILQQSAGPTTANNTGIDINKITYTRELVQLPDGGTVSLDWHTPLDNDNSIKHNNKPILLCLHGLTGGSLEAYMQWIVHATAKHTDCQIVVMNARGCGNTKLSTPVPFNAANTDDLRYVIQKLRKDVIGNDVSMYAVGVSLGSGILLKYVHEESMKYKQHNNNNNTVQSISNNNQNKQVGGLNGSIHVCTSFDHKHNTQSMEQSLVNFYLYNKTLGSNLVAYLKNHHDIFMNNLHTITKRFDLSTAYSSSYIGEFDRNVIVPLFNYNTVDDYYSHASTKYSLRDVEIPCLVLSSKDDPICSVACVDIDAVNYNDNVIMCLTTHGGHVGYIESSTTDKHKRESISSHGFHHLPLNIESYIEKPIIEFINAVQYNKQHNIV